MNKKHMPFLQWLANDVIAEILKDEDFDVFTPDAQEIGNIMHHVIRSADRADLVIADTTGNNPNVLYEMAVLDAMGRACVPVKLIDNENEEESISFDRAAYRYFRVPKGDTQGAIQKLNQVIQNVLTNLQEGEQQENPLTDYFGKPLSTIASAEGLARGYFWNFIEPALKGKVVRGPAFCKRGKSGLKLEIVIPEKIHVATRYHVEKLITSEVIIPITLDADGRDVNSFVWSQSITNEPILIDIPTALGQLRGTVLARLGPNKRDDENPDRPDYKILEQNETEQFLRYLRRQIFKNQNASAAHNEKRLLIVTATSCRKPDLFI